VTSHIEEIFALSDAIRYVAILSRGKLESSTKVGLQGASGSESDKYEELFVNPALLTLTRQRGDIDCGGCRFVLIRYGNFYQFVLPTTSGHVSVCIDQRADPIEIGGRIEQFVQAIR